MNKLILIANIFMALASFAQGSTGDVIGQVVNKDTGEELFFAKVKLVAGEIKYQTLTDVDGKFRISGILPGAYSLDVIYEFDTLFNIPIEITPDAVSNLGTIRMELNQVEICICLPYRRLTPIMDINGLPVVVKKYNDITISPLRNNISQLLTAMSSDVKQTNEDQLMIRGARKGDILYMLDGVKSNSIHRVPSCAVGKVSVYTGGLPAKYGDTTGGVVVVETKSYFDLLRQYRTRQLRAGFSYW